MDCGCSTLVKILVGGGGRTSVGVFLRMVRSDRLGSGRVVEEKLFLFMMVMIMRETHVKHDRVG
jgi:hypothetical protein